MKPEYLASGGYVRTVTVLPDFYEPGRRWLFFWRFVMNAEILCIGTELLHGDIANTNAQYISKRLAEIGIDVHYHSVVGDNPGRMKEAFRLAFLRCDVVICTGGLGPTKDDITKEILAEFFGVPMVYDGESFEHLKRMYSRFRKGMPENNMRQTYFPEGAKILTNYNGTANACIMRAPADSGDMRIGVLLPGPPREMQPLMDEQVIPYLHGFSHQVVVGERVVVMNVGESAAEEMIMDLIDAQSNPTIAPYASAGKVIFRITAKAEDREAAVGLIEPVRNELLRRFGSDAYVADSGNVDDVVAEILLSKNISIATAESCTGGMVASRLIAFAGISKVFREGFVSYSNEAKIRSLGVKPETLDRYGAVSEEVAKEMARGAAEATGADIGLATTGVAGPGGGTAEKPVGLVFVAVWYRGNSYVKQINGTGVRDTIRERAATAALDMVRSLIS